jgi:hypothetical protein
MPTLLNPSFSVATTLAGAVTIAFRDGREVAYIELDPTLALTLSFALRTSGPTTSPRPGRPGRRPRPAPRRLTFGLNLPHVEGPDAVPIRRTIPESGGTNP